MTQSLDRGEISPHPNPLPKGEREGEGALPTGKRIDEGAVVDTLDAWLRWKGCVLESELRGRRVLTDEKRVVDSRKVSKMLPEGSFLIEFAHTSFWDFEANKWQEAHYLAFVLSFGHTASGGDAAISLIDLGKADVIDGYVYAYRNEMGKGEYADEKTLSKISKELYRVGFEPIRKVIGRTDIPVCLFLSPDGSLNLIPFEVFMTPEGKYLIDDYQINYVSAGRDIMRFKATSPQSPPSQGGEEGEVGHPYHGRGKGRDVVIMADPDYDMDPCRKPDVIRRLGVGDIKKAADTGSLVSRDMRGLGLAGRLRGARKEARAIRGIVKVRYKPRIYLNVIGIEEVLYNIKEPPLILHLATHGFFLEDLDLEEKIMKKLEEKGWKDVQTMGSQAHEERLRAVMREVEMETTIEGSMLRSGICLAGYNTSVWSIKGGKKGKDGIVTARDIAKGFNLRGTWLVVASACDTAVGAPKVGEGVFGLKRAFVLAGAETLVMSLWKVPDEETKNLMVEFYGLMMPEKGTGKGKAEALRKTRLDMKEKKPHPYFWGAFISVGKPD